MNIKELKELIQDLPDEMIVESCCDNGGPHGTGTCAKIRTGVTSFDDWETEVEYEYLWVGFT